MKNNISVEPDRIQIIASRTIQVREYEPITRTIQYASSVKEGETPEQCLKRVNSFVESNLIKLVKPLVELKNKNRSK
jgi:hypothetical protein